MNKIRYFLLTLTVIASSLTAMDSTEYLLGFTKTRASAPRTKKAIDSVMAIASGIGMVVAARLYKERISSDLENTNGTLAEYQDRRTANARLLAHNHAMQDEIQQLKSRTGKNNKVNDSNIAMAESRNIPAIENNKRNLRLIGDIDALAANVKYYRIELIACKIAICAGIYLMAKGAWDFKKNNVSKKELLQGLIDKTPDLIKSLCLNLLPI